MKKQSPQYFVISEDMQPIQPGGNAFYVKVKSKKRSDDTISLASLLLTLPVAGETFETNLHLINPEQTAPYSDDKAPAVQRYNMELQIKDRSKAFNKATAKYNRQEEKSKKLEKEKMDIEGKIQKNNKRLQGSSIEVEAKRHQLAASFTQRENNRISDQTTVIL